MTWLKTYKKTVITAGISFFIPFLVFMSIFLHNAWGDQRYVQKEESIRQNIEALDMQLTIVDQEILFASDAREKDKFEAIKAIYKRKKEALRDLLENIS